MQKNSLFFASLGVAALLVAIGGKPAPANAFWLGVPESLRTLWQSAKAQEGGENIGSLSPAPQPTPPPSQPSQPPTPQQGQPPFPAPAFEGGREGYAPANGEGQPPNGQPPMPRPIFQREGYKIERDVEQFERDMQGVGEDGRKLGPATRERIGRVKEGADKLKRMEKPEDMKNFDMEGMEKDMNAMDGERRDKEREQRETKDLQRGVKDMSRGLKDFENQATRLTKKGIQLPTTVSENLAKAKTIIEAVKNAKNFEEAREAGMDDMQEVMQGLNESRMQLEMLARWPQMLKDMDRQLAMLGRDLKKAKATADKLAKKGVDVGSVLSKFEESVNKLKAVRDEADQKIKAGEAEDAMELVQDEFFGQMDDVMEGRKIIEMMSNLGRFNSEFKRGVAQAESEIKRLARRKLDVAELKTLLEEIKQKGQAVMDLLKGGDIDEEEVMSVMQEMEDMRQKFEEEIAELTGEEETQPWEKGTQQFKAIPVTPEMSKFMKRDSAEGSGERQKAP